MTPPKKFILGFTGTRKGMSLSQKRAFSDHLERWSETYEALEFHHGGCIGADADAHELFADLWPWHSKLVLHPSNLADQSLKAELDFGGFDDYEILQEFPPLDRNHHIVDASMGMIGSPGEMTPVLRSGTWATLRYAKKVEKKLIILPR